MTRLRLHNTLCIILLLLITTSCGAGRKATSHTAAPAKVEIKDRHKPQRHNGDPGFNVDSRLGSKMVEQARKWLGSPYRYGGADRSGTDCSGMTMTIYSEVAGVAIPRNSARQYEYCVSIGHEDLQPGDLVFFSSKSGGSNVSHVGLYVGGRKMIHASSSRGVVESSIDDNYWASHYYGSGRVASATYAQTGRKPSRRRNDEPLPAPENEVAPAVSFPPQENFADLPAPEIVEPAEVPAEPVPETIIEPEPAAAATAPASEADSPEDKPTQEEINTAVKDAFGL